MGPVKEQGSFHDFKRPQTRSTWWEACHSRPRCVLMKGVVWKSKSLFSDLFPHSALYFSSKAAVVYSHTSNGN